MLSHNGMIFPLYKRLLLPGMLSQKTRERGNKNGTTASKSGHRNSVNPAKTAPVYNGNCKRRHIFTNIPAKTEICIKQNFSLITRNSVLDSFTVLRNNLI